MRGFIIFMNWAEMELIFEGKAVLPTDSSWYDYFKKR